MEFKVGLVAEFYGVDGYTFKLNNCVFEAVEDESDGYRSMMEEVRMKDDTDGLIFFNQPIAMVEVVEAVPSESHYGAFVGYNLVDVVDGHVWLTLGTDNSDDYYPMFSFHYETKGEKVLRILET